MPGRGGGPDIKVLDAVTLQPVREFFALDPASSAECSRGDPVPWAFRHIGLAHTG